MERIALYSHDAYGLGHLRRNIAIAHALTEGNDRSVLLVAGTGQAGAFPLPEGVDVLTLPGFAKASDGSYGARSLRTSSHRLASLRANVLLSALDAFDPQALIVDKHPLGVAEELRPGLELLAERRARVVLGLRDILDEPRRAREEWDAAEGDEVVRDLYTDVWIYGDPAVYDLVRHVGLGDDVAAKAQFTGYLGLRAGAATPSAHDASLASLELPEGPLALCLAGGGEDGFALADAFGRTALPDGLTGVVVTGPFMPRAEQRALRARARADLRVVNFVADPSPLIDRADRVVAMGGYNTVCELLSRDKRSLIVPRVVPRREQLIRARQLAARGVLDTLHPSEVTPRALARWMAAGDTMRRPVRDLVDLDGLARLPGLLGRAPNTRRPRVHAA